MQYPKAILFDLDDTILELNTSVEKCWCIVCSRFTAKSSDITAEKLMAAIDEARNWYWSDPARHRDGRLKLLAARREVVNLAFSRLGIDDTEGANALADAYGQEMDKHMAPFPGAIETLQQIRRSKVKLALLTNGSSVLQRKKIERFRLAQYFDIILIEEESGYGKPDQRIFQYALAQLKVKAAEAWMVGDDLERDIAGAQQAGIYTIWVDSKSGVDLAASGVKPDRVIKSIRELI